jgi:hypothetical protein
MGLYGPSVMKRIPILGRIPESRVKQNFCRFGGGEIETKYFFTNFAVLRIIFSTVKEVLESSNIVAMK